MRASPERARFPTLFFGAESTARYALSTRYKRDITRYATGTRLNKKRAVKKESFPFFSPKCTGCKC